jgi:hypothetical protein
MTSTLEMVSWHDKTYRRAVHALAIGGERHDLTECVRRFVSDVPLREIERLRAAERRGGSRLDYTHPPTIFRIAALEGWEPTAPSVVLEAASSKRIDDELRALAPLIEREVVADAIGALYA